MVMGEFKKAGSGIMLFAYGGPSTLGHFVAEAEHAGRSIREHNPGVSMTIVTNNATIDYSIFDTHITPRKDLIFAGDTENGGQKRGDGFPRQWLTRLYYLAHSPYELTWALDSNVLSCTPHAASTFLNHAYESNLWDFTIAHASQNLLGRGLAEVMYPHNFNLIFMWREETSALLRDWLMLQLRQGVASDDQKTLHFAELRLARRMGNRLRIGRISPEMGASFYSVLQDAESPGGGQLRPNGARITPVLRGRVSMIHSTNHSLCAVFNRHVGSGRQILLEKSGSGPRLPSDKSGPGSVVEYTSLKNQTACATKLGADAQYCLLEVAPTGEDTRATDTLSRQSISYNSYITHARLEDYTEYVRSARCGELCANSESWDMFGKILPSSIVPKLRYTPCRSFVGMRMGTEALVSPFADSMTCPPGHLLRLLMLSPDRTLRAVPSNHSNEHAQRTPVPLSLTP